MKAVASINNTQQLASFLAMQLPSPVVPLSLNWDNPNQCQLWIKRDDMIHAIISGNKWRKLSHQLLAILKQKNPSEVHHIVSFGGMHSNHLHALAYVAKQLGIHFTAIVRGHATAPKTATLNDMLAWGCEVVFVDRVTYKRRDQADYLEQLAVKYPNAYFIPEGGSHVSAIAGVVDLVKELTLLDCNADEAVQSGLSGNFQTGFDPDFIICPVGSGGTLAGLIASQTSARCVGVSVLKDEGYLEDEVKKLLAAYPLKQEYHSQWHILHQYHHGGYGKRNTELLAFCQDFQQQTDIEIEATYSGKLMYAVKQELAKGAFPVNSHILLLHTGGLQGNR